VGKPILGGTNLDETAVIVRKDGPVRIKSVTQSNMTAPVQISFERKGIFT
jgi:hypothetical protein